MRPATPRVVLGGVWATVGRACIALLDPAAIAAFDVSSDTALIAAHKAKVVASEGLEPPTKGL